MTNERLQIQRLNREHLPIQTVKMARYLIGKTLVHDLPRVRLAGRIVETEAYVTGDAASHAFRGLTARNRTLFLERGHVYVYFIYGNHFMLNISGQREGIGEGVLLRAIEPLEGIEQMKRYRGTERLLDLARGPGRLAEAFGISRRLDGADLCAGGRVVAGRRGAPQGTHWHERADWNQQGGAPAAAFLRAREPVRERNKIAPGLAETPEPNGPDNASWKATSASDDCKLRILRLV